RLGGPAYGVGVHLGRLPRLADHGVGDVDAGLGPADHRHRSYQRGDEPGAALQHEVDRLVVQVDAVLDGAGPGAYGVLDALGALGVGHDVAALSARLGDQDVEFRGGELAVPGVVARGEDAAG